MKHIMKHIMEYKLFNPPVLIKHIPEKPMAHGFLGVRTSRKMPREPDDDFYWNLAYPTHPTQMLPKGATFLYRNPVYTG